jgi:hypothetical protein
LSVSGVGIGLNWSFHYTIRVTLRETRESE